MIWQNGYCLMIWFVSLLQAPTVSIYPAVQKTKFVWYEDNNNNNNNNNNNRNNNNNGNNKKIKVTKT